MEQRAPVSPAVTTSQSSTNHPHPHEDRNVWVLTAYGIAGLVLFAVLAYYFVQYITNT